MQRTIRVPNKWLVMIGLLWSIVFAALISATGATVDEPRIEGLTPEEALELARTLPPHLDWKLLYPDEALEQNSSYAYRSGIEVSHRSAFYYSNAFTAEHVSEKIRLLDFVRTTAITPDVAKHAAVELAFVYKLQGAPQRAVDLLESIVANGSIDDELSLDAVLILARSYRQLAQDEQAEDLLRSTIEKLQANADDSRNQMLPNARWLYFELGLLLEFRGDMAAAHNVYDTLIEWSVLPQSHHRHLENRLAVSAPAVEGQVTLNGQPLSGIRMSLYKYVERPDGSSRSGQPTASSITDASGVFKLYEVPPGTYDVAVELPAWVQADIVRFEPTVVAVKPETTAESNVALERFPGFQVTAQVHDGEIAWPPYKGWSKKSANPAYVELKWDSDVQPAGYWIEMSLWGAGTGIRIIASEPRQTWGSAIMLDDENIKLDDIIFDHYGFIIPGSQSSLKFRLDAPIFTRLNGGAIAVWTFTRQLGFHVVFGIGEPSATLRFKVIPLNENNEPLVGGQGGYLIPGAQVITSGAAEIEIVPPRPQLTAADQVLLAHDYETAITLYEEQLEADPNDEHSLFVLWYLYKNGTDWSGTFRNPERAKELGERLLEITQNIETRNTIQRQLQQAKGNS